MTSRDVQLAWRSAAQDERVMNKQAANSTNYSIEISVARVWFKSLVISWRWRVTERTE
jgi:hypothetical protein